MKPRPPLAYTPRIFHMKGVNDNHASEHEFVTRAVDAALDALFARSLKRLGKPLVFSPFTKLLVEREAKRVALSAVWRPHGQA